MDLSSPDDHSVDASVPKEPYSLPYIFVDPAIVALMEMGPWVIMAKFDIECAYRNAPIDPGDRYLLGMHWRGQFYVDLTLPFGLRSEPLSSTPSQPWSNGFYGIITISEASSTI